MRKILFTFSVWALMFTQQTWANGGPVSWTETTPLGAIGLEQNKDVILVNEDLKIKVIDLNSYSVQATYELSANHSKSNLKFGVPINWYDEEHNYRNSKIKTVEREPTKKIEKEIDSISKKIIININGKNTHCDPVYDSRFFKFEKEKDSKFNSLSYVRGWCLADINFKKGLNKLVLKYHAQMNFEDLVFSKSALTEFSDRKLTYLLYPAGFWNGVVSKVNITIDPGPYFGYMNIEQPTKFTKNKNKWVWTQDNVDLKKVRKISVVFNSAIPEASELATWNKHSYVKLNEIATVSASSELAPSKNNTYSAKNVLDGNPKTAWCQDKSLKGKKEYLEFKSTDKTFSEKIEKYCGIQGLMTTSGYMKNQHVYKLNNLVTKVALSDCEGKNRNIYSLKNASDYRFGATLTRNRMPDGAWNKFMTMYKKKHGNDFRHMKEYDNRPRNKMDFIKNSSCFRVEILDIKKGKADDTCISEMALVINCG